MIEPSRPISRTATLFHRPFGVGKLLAGNVGREHEAALGDGKHCHASLVVAIGCGIVLPATRPRRGLICTYARRGSRPDGDGAGASRKFKFTGFKFIQESLLLEEYDLAVRLAARLKPDAQLRHDSVADHLIVHIYLTLAPSSADDEATGANGWEYGVRIAIGEKDGALSGMLEQLDCVIVFVGVCHTRTQQ